MRALILIPALWLSACSGDVKSPYAQSDFNPQFAAWTSVTVGMDADAAEKILRERLGKTIEGPGGLIVNYDVKVKNGSGYIVGTQEGALDSTISAQQVYISVRDNAVDFRGLRHKCKNGPSADSWTAVKCP